MQFATHLIAVGLMKKSALKRSRVSITIRKSGVTATDAGQVNHFTTSPAYGTDAFRMMAVGIGKLVKKGSSAEEWRDLRAQYIG